MTITVNTPDGGTAQFPDDTPQDAIVGAMKAKFGGPSDDKPMFSVGPGSDKVGEFVGKVADAATAGFGAQALDKLGLAQGSNGETVAKQVENAGQDIGPLASGAADIAGYAIGPGKLGIGARIAEGAAARLGARGAQALGSAGEAAAASAAGDIGHGETPGWDVLGNATVGGALGGIIGGRGRALAPAVERAAGKGSVGDAIADLRGPENPPPAAKSVEDLQAAADAKFKTLETTPVSTRTVKSAISSALGDLTPGQQADLSTAMRGQIGDIGSAIANSSGLTLGDAYSFQRSLGSIKYTPGDRVAAAKVGEALRALSPQMGDAALAHGQLADATRLTGQLKNMGWFGTGADAIASAQKGTAPGAVRAYSPAGREAMEALANAGPSPLTQAMQHAAAFGVNKAIGAVGGHWIGGALGEGGLGTLIGAQAGTGPMNIGRALTQMRSSAAAKRAMKAALAATSTGLPATADQFRNAPWLSQAARQALYANAAQGQ